MIKDVGLFLRQSMLNAFSNSEELPWPPLPSKFSYRSQDVSWICYVWIEYD